MPGTPNQARAFLQSQGVKPEYFNGAAFAIEPVVKVVEDLLSRISGLSLDVELADFVAQFCEPIIAPAAVSLTEREAGEEGTITQEPQGKKLIAAERQRQITIEGWTREHDDAHKPQELEQAGEYYRALPESRPYMTWPWEHNWFKPTPEDRVRELVKAGALFQAAADSAYRKDYKYDCELLEAKVESVAEAIDSLLAARTAAHPLGPAGAASPTRKGSSEEAEVAGYHSTELSDISSIITWLHAQNKPMGELMRRFFSDARQGKVIKEYNDIDPLPQP